MKFQALTTTSVSACKRWCSLRKLFSSISFNNSIFVTIAIATKKRIIYNTCDTCLFTNHFRLGTIFESSEHRVSDCRGYFLPMCSVCVITIGEVPWIAIHVALLSLFTMLFRRFLFPLVCTICSESRTSGSNNDRTNL